MHTPTSFSSSTLRSEAGTTVSDVGEHELIARLRKRLVAPPAFVTIGIGDDAAIVEPPRNQLLALTTDALIEGIHFDRAYASGADVGFKALAVNLSDLAAMGATPQVALLSLGVPAALPAAFIDELIDGINLLAGQTKTGIVGGNIARSPGPIIVDMTVSGAVKRRRILTRHGARPGDHIYVSGSLGAAAAALSIIRSRAGGDPHVRDASEGWPSALRCHLRPTPRLRLGLLLGRNKAATSCIDISDGLASAVRQLCDASGCGAMIDAATIPVADSARLLAGETEAIGLALQGGEDYELLFTASPRHGGRLQAVERLVKDVPITRIGQMVSDKGVLLRHDGRVDELPEGFVHF